MGRRDRLTELSSPRWPTRAVLSPAPSGLVVHELTSGTRRVRGVVGLLGVLGARGRAEEVDRSQAALLPHEGAIAERAARLADRMAALALDPAPILLLHRSSDGPGLADALDHLVARPPDVSAVDGHDNLHRWWDVQDAPSIGRVARAVTSAQLLIADGHHRYAAHLDLAARDPRVGDGRALVMITDADRDAPTLSPIHRVWRSTSSADVVRRLGAAGHRVCSEGSAGSHGSVATAHDPDVVLVEDATRVTAVRVHDRGGDTVVECVHRALSSPADRGSASRWSTHHEAAEARDAVRRGPGRVALILPAPTMDEVWAAARQGRLLPAKATSFTPKPPLGLVFRSWRDG